MASLYQRKDSAYWWVKYRDERGDVRQVSTKCRIDSTADKRRAKQIEAEHTLAELKRGGALQRKEGWAWVTDFLKTRYQTQSGTLGRYLTAWQTLRLFLDEKAIISPRRFVRAHCLEFVQWRQSPDVGKGKYRAGHNTALLEIKTMRLILHEAVERGMITGNPCVRLGLKRERQKMKPELTDADCEMIRTSITEMDDGPAKEMFHLSFEIARHQGCRLMETQLNPMTDVEILGESLGTITFRIKGGREFATALHPNLIPLFRQLQAEKRTYTWKTPKGKHPVWASSRWWKLMDRLGLKNKGACFHSTRVTVVTELARGNVHESKAQSFIGHASTTVHRIYQRLRPADLAECAAVVGKRPKS